MLRVSDTERIFILSEYGYGKRTDFDNFNAHGRGTGGQVIYAPDDKTGELVGAISVLDDDNVMVITSQGKTLKISADTVNILGKAARGVKIVNIERPDFVIALDRIAKDELEDEVVGAEEPGLEPGPESNTEEIVPRETLDEEEGGSESGSSSSPEDDEE